MGLVTAAIFSFNYEAIFGSVFLMLSHGIVSSGLFLMVGFLYEKHHTRVLKYYSGLIHVMPLFSFFFIVFTLGNIGLPGTSSFIGEILIIIGCFKMNS
jgi:NADH-quinone oxidoreductase subunit M